MSLIPSVLREALAAFSANVAAVLKERDMKAADIARTVGGRGGPSKKTVYNVLQAKHPPHTEQLAHIADALGIPLWVLLVPGLDRHREILRDAGELKALTTLVENYLASTPGHRTEIADVARGLAVLTRRS